MKRNSQEWRPCPNCRGTGKDFYTHVCEFCHGAGKLPIGMFRSEFRPGYRGF